MGLGGSFFGRHNPLAPQAQVDFLHGGALLEGAFQGGGRGVETTLLKCHRVMLQRNLSFLHVSLAYMETCVFGNFLYATD